METGDVVIQNKALYWRYLDCCNARAFDRLGQFVADSVRVNGQPCGLARHRQGLAAVVEAFPDYEWSLERLIGEGNWLAALFTDRGTHRSSWLGVPPTGRTISTMELAIYHVFDGKVAEVWSHADDLGVVRQLANDTSGS